MRKVWKKSTWTQRIIVLLSIIILGTYYYFSKGHIPFSKETQETVKVAEKKTEDMGTVVEITEPQTVFKDVYPLDMSEDLVMDAIHGMSHQKVKAGEKWSFVPLTAERVTRLLAVVEHNKAKYHHADLYLDILERWAKGDYSQAVLDHNSIWHLQDGTIGEASRLLTAKEEEKYIKEHFSAQK